MTKLKIIFAMLAFLCAIPCIALYMHMFHPKLMWKQYKDAYKKDGLWGMIFSK